MFYQKSRVEPRKGRLIEGSEIDYESAAKSKAKVARRAKSKAARAARRQRR